MVTKKCDGDPRGLLTEVELREKCHACPHEYGEHNSMGDCRVLDGRTRTGLCGCPGA